MDHEGVIWAVSNGMGVSPHAVLGVVAITRLCQYSPGHPPGNQAVQAARDACCLETRYPALSTKSMRDCVHCRQDVVQEVVYDMNQMKGCKSYKGASRPSRPARGGYRLGDLTETTIYKKTITLSPLLHLGGCG